MRNFAVRVNIVIILVIALSLSCVIKLFDLQVIKGASYEQVANRRLVRAYSIEAPRGEILDKNGKPLVENRIGYNIQIQKIDIENDKLNEILSDVAYLAASYGSKIESTFPIIKEKNVLVYDFTIEKNGGVRKVDGVDYKESETPEKEKPQDSEIEAWKKTNKLKEFNDIKDILNFYRNKYEIASAYNENQVLTIAAIRYAMEKSSFDEKNPYILARDVDEMVVQKIKEQFMKYPGVDVVISPVRTFSNGTMAAHILGRTGKIYAEEYAVMKDKGYGMNDIIGKDGLEKVLEEYLKGVDGYKSVEMSRAGGVTEILASQAPKPGNYAKLTIDSDLQGVMEKALSEQIMASYGYGGAGAAIAIDPKTGGVLAMASYPTYDLSTFNEDYDELLKSKSTPLLNRVLSGTYSPGSTFKPLTSIAALETGVINPNTYITDKGKYTYYKGYNPTCLVYSSTGKTHGTINVSEAIGVSCNYFFYEVGRLTTIETIDEYATKFGLGQRTGIELGESTGILASPQNREKAGGTWYPGDVLQAAIGQSDNMFTPVQLASYIATFLNKGKRYSVHLVDEVADYDTGEIKYKSTPKVLSETSISDATYDAVKKGMRNVVLSGTAKDAFLTAKYKAAGKTGTAEVPDGRDNVLFVGFAPYEEPEIVIAVVIEHGANSFYAANVARRVFDAYMEIKNGTFGKEDNEPEKEEEIPSSMEPIEDELVGGTVPQSTIIEDEERATEGTGTL